MQQQRRRQLFCLGSSRQSDIEVLADLAGVGSDDEEGGQSDDDWPDMPLASWSEARMHVSVLLDRRERNILAHKETFLVYVVRAGISA